jgi:hypothetical protein
MKRGYEPEVNQVSEEVSNLFVLLPPEVLSTIMSNLTKAHLNVVSCVAWAFYNAITSIVTVLDLRQYFEITSAKIEGSLRRYKHLHELHFNASTPLKMFPAFSESLFRLNLRVFSAPYSNLTQGALVKIGESFTNLERLDVSGNKVNHKVLCSLAKLPHLKSLDIGYSRERNLVPGLAESLNEFTTLTDLSLAGIDLKDFDFATLQLRNLQSLNVSETFVKPDFSPLSPLSELTFVNFFPASRPIAFPDSLKTLDTDIGTFYSVTQANIETLCLRKQNDAVDDLLSLTDRTSVRTLELRQFKVHMNVFMPGVAFLLKRMPNVTVCFLQFFTLFFFLPLFLFLLISFFLSFFFLSFFYFFYLFIYSIIVSLSGVSFIVLVCFHFIFSHIASRCCWI